jgi:pimeloyl-ACP methyl ester carboxylesterase
MPFKAYWSTPAGQRSLRALGFFVAFYVGLTVFTALSQERLIYLPTDQEFADCPAVQPFGLTPQEYNGTRFYAPLEVSSSSRVVVVYHGNAGSACHRAYYLPFIVEAGATALLVEYTGYSNDNVSPSHERVKADVANIVQYLETRAVTTTTIIGESIGSGPAVLHASLRSPHSLILITPFTDLKALANYHYWYFPTDLLVQNAFDNVETLSQYTGPRTFIHGTEDTIVPYFMSQELATIQEEQTTLLSVEGADHNNLLMFPGFAKALSSSLTEPVK